MGLADKVVVALLVAAGGCAAAGVLILPVAVSSAAVRHEYRLIRLVGICAAATAATLFAALAVWAHFALRISF